MGDDGDAVCDDVLCKLAEVNVGVCGVHVLEIRLLVEFVLAEDIVVRKVQVLLA